MMKKDVLFLCQFFYPEYNSSATLPFDTARYLSQSGLSVAALCGYPKEYCKKNDIPKLEKVNDIDIKRIRYLQLQRVMKLGRLINYFSFTTAVFCHMSLMKNYKTLIVYSNPPVLPLAAVVANKLYGTKIVFVSYDVYPDIACATGSISQTSVIAKTMRWINRRVFNGVDAVVALTDEMKKYLVENRANLSPDIVHVISNWAHEDVQPAIGFNSNDYGFKPTDFVVSYFGNMGVCQDIDTLLDAMDILRDHAGIKFFIAGHGCKKNRVIERTQGNKNVVFSDFLTDDAFKNALAASSCGIVSLERGLGGMCAPSKYYSYLQAGLPVITVTDLCSYLAQEVDREKIGGAVAVGDGAALAKLILNWAGDRDKVKLMSAHASKLYGSKYAKKIGLDKYKKLIMEVIGAENE